MMNGEPIKQGKRGFEGKNYDIEFKDVKFSYKKTPVVAKGGIYARFIESRKQAVSWKL